MTAAALAPSAHPVPRSVLIADQESSSRARLAREFARHGYEVHVSDEAEPAADLALRLQPALVVLELRLRAGSGLSLLTSLRPRLPATRFVVVTSFGSVATAVRAMRLGAAGYLCKPINVEHVLEAASDTAPEESPGPAAPIPEDHGGEELRTLTLDQAIWEYIHLTLEASGSLSEAARRLGLWRQSLKRMITKYRPTDSPSLPGRV